MLSRKCKPVPHPRRQRNTLADWRSLAGFGGKSWNSLGIRHPLAKTSLAKEMSPFQGSLVTLHPTWMRHVTSLWVSPLEGIWRCQKPIPGLGSPATLHSLWPDLQTKCYVLHGTAGSAECGHQIACLCPACWWRRSGNREGKGAGFGLWVCAGKTPGFVFVLCEQSLLLVSGNSVPFLLSEAPYKAQFLAN